MQREGESGPEGLSSLLCFLLVQRKYRAHLLSAELLLHYQLFLPVTGLCCSTWLFSCRLGVFPHLPIAATLVQFFFPLLLFECSILSASSSSPISFCQLVLVSWWCFLLCFLFNLRDFFSFLAFLFSYLHPRVTNVLASTESCRVKTHLCVG